MIRWLESSPVSRCAGKEHAKALIEGRRSADRIAPALGHPAIHIRASDSRAVTIRQASDKSESDVLIPAPTASATRWPWLVNTRQPELRERAVRAAYVMSDLLRNTGACREV